jgi:hypothetical protein
LTPAFEFADKESEEVRADFSGARRGWVDRFDSQGRHRTRMALRGSGRKLVLAISFGIAGGASALADQPFSPTSRIERHDQTTAKSTRLPARHPERTAAFRSSSRDASEALVTKNGTAGRTEAIDVVLDSGNTLRGRFVDAEGQPIDGAVVTLSQGTEAAARTTTNADGVFELRRVPNGSYRLACGSAAGRVRCWSTAAAPPNALAGGVTFQDGVIRGQAALLIPAIGTNALVSGAATAGAVVGGVAMSSTSHGNRSLSISGPQPGGETEPMGNLTAGIRTDPIVPSDPFNPQVEYLVVDGKLVRVVHPHADGEVDGFANEFGDPRDQGLPRRITGDAIHELPPDGFAPEDTLPYPDDLGDDLPASP